MSSSSTITPTALAKRRMRFSDKMDVVLLKSAKKTGAHVAKHGSLTDKYNEVRKLFFEEYQGDDANENWNWKSLYTRVCRLLSLRRAEKLQNVSVNGITENLSELEMLLDEMILDVDHFEEEKRKKRECEMATKINEHLVEGGDDLQIDALHRIGSATNEVSDEYSGRKRKFVSDSDDEERELLLAHAHKQQEQGKKKIKLDEERLNMEKKRLEKEDTNADRLYELQARRLQLDEQRFALEAEERRAQILQRKLEIEERRAQAEERKKYADLLTKILERLG